MKRELHLKPAIRSCINHCILRWVFLSDHGVLYSDPPPAVFLDSVSINMVNYMQRYEIVNGTVEAEGATAEVAKTEEGEEESAEGIFFGSVFVLNLFCFCVCILYIDISSNAEKGVPNFWLTALKNNEVTAEEVSY